ncbi:collagen-binding domain-containing protein [Limosilactobacillus sp.]|uniref:collagen-binding domain-containing protein n=1 Tax=Limosilactobacillus sp. TaxID=2773925 RepID=UPI0035A111D8
MVSKKNIKLLEKKMQPRKQRFGLRKLSFGLVSVLLGLLFIAGGQSASADEAVTNEPTPAQMVAETSNVEIDNAENSNVVSKSTNNEAVINPDELTSVTNVTSSTSSANDGPNIGAVTPTESAEPASVSPVTPSETVSNTVPVESNDSNVASPAASDGLVASSNAENMNASSNVMSMGTADSASDSTISQAPASASTAPAPLINTADKISTDAVLKDKYGIDVNHLNAKSVLLLASLFHIFANEANLGADVNGNIAVGILNANVDFGTRGDSINLTNGDVYYIQQLTAALQSGSFRNNQFNHVIFGKDVNVEVIDGKVYINGRHMNNLKAEDVFKDSDGGSYIDFPAVFSRLISASNFYTAQEESKGLIKNFTDMNNRYVDVSNAQPVNNVIYINLPAELLDAPQPIKLYGLSSRTDGPMIVINVIGSDGVVVNVGTQILLHYDDNKNPLANSESHAMPNHVLWNFGTGQLIINVHSGRFMGSILAPNATINAHVNIDGNIVANIVNVKGGETHRWDIHPVGPPSFIEEPEQPTDPQPTDPQPTDPQPTDPQPTDPQPTDPQPTDPQPTDPQPTDPQPTDPQPTDPQPTDPQPTDPQPTDPQPTDPQPTDPQPTDPQPTDPQPTDPQPTDPQPTDPQPTDPQPTDPQPTDPQPTDPQPTDPQPTDPQPTDPQPTDPQPTDPQPTDPQPTDPQPTDPQPTDPQPTDPQPTDPQPTDPQPTDPQPTDPQPTDPQPTDPQPIQPSVEMEDAAAGPVQPTAPVVPEVDAVTPIVGQQTSSTVIATSVGQPGVGQGSGSQDQATTLPQTGADHQQLALAGLILAITAQLITLGVLSNKKKKQK